ncbi:MAG: SUMF1/EgtB/PvdO family nonheme iron enzyme [Saprospiraceae bacterium]
MIRIICLFFPFLFLSFGPHRPVPVRKGQDLAVFFAVDTYRHSNLADLQNPVKNAADIAGVLHKRFGFDTLVVRNPSLVQVEEKLNDLYSRYARNLDGRTPSAGQLLVFFSGHGKEHFGEGYFLPADADPAIPHRTGLPYTYLRNLINSINCDHIMVAVDACFSANFEPDRGNKPDREFKRPGELSEVEKTLLNHRQYKARLFFTSDAIGDMTPDRSNFARKMLEGLDDFQSPAGFMTSSELFANYIEKASPTPHGGDFGDDDPRSAFLFFFEKSATPQVDPVLDKQAWEEAKTANTLAAFQFYQARFPNGEFRPLADKRIAEFEDFEAWQQAKAANTKAAYEKYLSAYPSGAYRELAENALKNLLTQQPNNPTTPSEPSDAKNSNMVFVKGGTFIMGCTNEQGSDCDDEEKPAHRKRVRSFYMGKYEVTNREFCEFLNEKGNQTQAGNFWLEITSNNCLIEKRESRFVPKPGKENHPVVEVSWYGAQAYCNWLKEKTGNPYRLPTEFEWEYAARGGKASQGYKYAGSNSLDEVGWYTSNSGGGTNPVGQKKANELGLFDMSGNVWEWCQDYWNESYKGTPAKGQYWLSEYYSCRVFRGGSWYNAKNNCRVPSRQKGYAEDWVNGIGFRVVQDSN